MTISEVYNNYFADLDRRIGANSPRQSRYVENWNGVRYIEWPEGSREWETKDNHASVLLESGEWLQLDPDQAMPQESVAYFMLLNNWAAHVFVVAIKGTSGNFAMRRCACRINWRDTIYPFAPIYKGEEPAPT